MVALEALTAPPRVAVFWMSFILLFLNIALLPIFSSDLSSRLTREFSIPIFSSEFPSIVISVKVAFLPAPTLNKYLLKSFPLSIFAFVPARDISPAIDVVPTTIILFIFWLLVAISFARAKDLTALPNFPSKLSSPETPSKYTLFLSGSASPILISFTVINFASSIEPVYVAFGASLGIFRIIFPSAFLRYKS